jgi:serine/threonine protein kinase
MSTAADSFGDYRLDRVLGEGASATVHLAQHRGDGRWVALKIMAPQGRTDAQADARERFVREAEVVRRLHHPGIVAIHEVGQTDGRLWLAMEAVPGCSLERYVRGNRLLPPPLVARIGERVARALAYAHGHGVVHRDLKPANVLVDWPSDTVKVADFGLARGADAAQTATGLVLGTPAYMAPEQLAGSVPTAATDLYALGVMLYQLVAGRLPHDAATMGELLRQVAREPAPDLLQLQPGTPAALAAQIAGLMAKRAADRPPGAQAAAEALGALELALRDAGTGSH